MAKKKNKQVRCGQLVSNNWFIPFSLFDHGAGIANVNSKMKKVCGLAWLAGEVVLKALTVLMQHQKAKHFKCPMCPRRLNTAGGLAVHIQQVHKLEPEKYVSTLFLGSSHQPCFSLPRIDNALPGRDGYEVEIFGMEGIPAPDVADFKRRKEIELGLAAGSISQPQAKRPKIDNRVIAEDELRRQLQEHKALMGLNNPEPSTTQESTSAPAIYAAPQTYAAPPVPLASNMPPPNFPPMPPGMSAIPPGFPPSFPPGMPPGYVHFPNSWNATAEKHTI
jgi:hypothetical protein